MNGVTKKLSVALTLMCVAGGVNAQQSCNASIAATAPDAAFEVHGDGTVTHTTTGLMWSTCLVGQAVLFGGTCDGAAFEETWAEAHVLAQSDVTGGYTDWRLPNVNELVSLQELQCDSPAMNLNIFPAVENTIMLWTSTPTTLDGMANAVMIGLGLPDLDLMTSMHPFLLVRDN